MAPLADEHRVRVFEVRHHEGRIGALDDRVQGLRTVRESDCIITQLEVTRFRANRRAGDDEWPAALRMLEAGYRCTIDATAAAAAATWRGSGP